MTDICYLTFEADVISEPTKTEKGNVSFLTKTKPALRAPSFNIRVLLREEAAQAIVSMGDKIHITHGSVYVDKKATSEYLFNVAVKKRQFIHVISYDDGIKEVDKVTGGF